MFLINEVLYYILFKKYGKVDYERIDLTLLTRVYKWVHGNDQFINQSINESIKIIPVLSKLNKS